MPQKRIIKGEEKKMETNRRERNEEATEVTTEMF